MVAGDRGWACLLSVPHGYRLGIAGRKACRWSRVCALRLSLAPCLSSSQPAAGALQTTESPESRLARPARRPLRELAAARSVMPRSAASTASRTPTAGRASHSASAGPAGAAVATATVERRRPRASLVTTSVTLPARPRRRVPATPSSATRPRGHASAVARRRTALRRRRSVTTRGSSVSPAQRTPIALQRSRYAPSPGGGAWSVSATPIAAPPRPFAIWAITSAGHRAARATPSAAERHRSATSRKENAGRA